MSQNEKSIELELVIKCYRYNEEGRLYPMFIDMQEFSDYNILGNLNGVPILELKDGIIESDFANRTAKLLYVDMQDCLVNSDNYAKDCALIACRHLIKEQNMWQNGEVNPNQFWQKVEKYLLEL